MRIERASAFAGTLAVAGLLGGAFTDALARNDASAIPKAGGTIAFQHKVWGKTADAIYLMNADGSDRRLLTTGRAFEWSPDARQIAFNRRPTAGFGMELWVVARDGSGLRRLVADLLGGWTWSPDGQHIAFVGRYGNTLPMSFAIYVVDSDGGGLTRLTAPPRGLVDTSPSWSPDGSRIAFVRGTHEPPGRLITMNPDGADQRTLIRGFSIGAAEWSPDSSEIAYDASRTPEGQSDIYVIDRLGNKRRNITRTPSFWEAQQRWSPNGRLIVYVRFTSGGPWRSSVRLVTVGGTGSFALDSPKTNGDEPSWSPDGRSIVFVSRRDGNQDLYVVTRYGQDQTNLTNDRLPTQNTEPEWVAR